MTKEVQLKITQADGRSSSIAARSGNVNVVSEASFSRIEFVNPATGKAPSKVRARRSKQDLVLEFEDSGEVVSVTLENYYVTGGELMGVNEAGQLVAYGGMDGAVFSDLGDGFTTTLELAGGVSGSGVFSGTGMLMAAGAGLLVASRSEGSGSSAEAPPSPNNTIRGTDGDDNLSGRNGNDVISAGNGNDTINGGAGDDTIDGGNGNDTLAGGEGNDSILGGAGNDHLDGGSGNDTLYGGDGEDTLYGGAGNDLLDGGNGNDVLVGGGGADTLYGGNGDDRIQVGAGSSTVDGGAGNDTLDLSQLVGPITVSTANGISVFVDAAGSVVRVTNVESYTLGGNSTVAAVNVTVPGTNGNDTITTGNGNDSIDGGDGDDSIDAGNGNDTISGGVGNDTIDGGNGDDRVDGGEGSDSINGGAGNDTIDGGNGNDTLAGGEGNDSILGGAGNDHLDGGNGNDTLYGGDGEDTLYGGAGNDLLDGGNGNDVLVGGGGADTLYGGNGDDRIQVGAGSSTVDGGAGNDTLDLSQLVGPITVSTANGISVFVDAAGSVVRVTNVESYTLGGNSTVAAVNVTVPGTNGNDTITTGNGNDSIDGGDGDDSIDAGNGNDTISGGVGNDTIDGGNGDDRVDGGEGSDSINGGAGNDTIDGGNGNDTLAGGEGNDSILGGAGNDHLDGGNGNDTLYGGDGEDTLYGGAGNDLLDGGNGNDVLVGGGGADTLYGGNGDDRIQVGAGSSTVDGGAGNDTLDLSQLVGPITVSTANGISVFVDAAGSVVQATNVESYTLGGNGTVAATFTTVPTTDGNDSVNGTNGRDSIDGGEGDDSIYGMDGDDVMDGGNGNDILDGGAGNDTIYGGNGNDLVFGDNGDDVLLGGNDNDTLYGGAGNDVLDGGNGNDVLVAGGGNDNLIGGDGNDSIVAGVGNSTVDGGNGIDTLDLSGLSGIITVSTDTVSGYTVFTDSVGNVVHALNIEAYVLGANSTVAAASSIPGGDTQDNVINGDSLANLIHGEDGNDTIYGNDGNDTLYGDDGDDVLDGGNGDDLLYGGNGDDSLVGGNGNDTLVSDAGTDTLVGGSGTDWADFSARDVDLAITINAGNMSGVENIVGGNGNDTLVGDAGDNVIIGGNGDDVLSGGLGNDTLVGGLGNNSINGGGGTDWVSYASDTAGIVLDLALGVDTNDDGVVDYTISTAQRLSGSEIDTLVGIEHVLGGNGNDMISGDSLTNVLMGGNGNDTLAGGAGNVADTLNGGAGSDWADYSAIAGGVVVDLGASVASGAAGTDVLISIENVAGGAGNDLLTANSTGSHLRGNGGADTLIGGAGSDTLEVGGAYALYDSVTDTTTYMAASINAGSGNDLVILQDMGSVLGGNGDDTIQVGSGVDWLNTRIRGDAGTNVLAFAGQGDTIDFFTRNESGVVGSPNVSGIQVIDLGGNTLNMRPTEQPTYMSVIEQLTGQSAAALYIKGESGSRVELTSGFNYLSMATIGGVEYKVFTNQAMTAYGYDGNDTIYVESDVTATYTTYLGAGNDSYVGTAGNDLIYGRSGSDTISGMGGDDTIIPDGRLDVNDVAMGAGNDILDGGSNNPVSAGGGDWISYAYMQDVLQGVTVNLGSGSAMAEGHVDLFVNFEHVMGSYGSDSIVGDIGDNYLSGGYGRDTLMGGIGNDTVEGGIGDDVLIAGNSIADANGFSTMNGTSDWVFYGNAISGVTVSLYGPLDTAIGGDGNDTLYGFENVYGSRFADSIYGDALNSIFNGGAGNDTLYGMDGNDTLIGGEGSDYLRGGLGNDLIVGGTGDLSWLGDQGVDTLDLTGMTVGVRNTYFGTTINGYGGMYVIGGGATVRSQADSVNAFEHILLGSGNDTWTSSNITAVANETINAGAGDDIVYSGAQDYVLGGAGNDTLQFSGTSGNLNTTMQGGTGVDWLWSTYNSGNTTIDMVAGTMTATTKTGTGRFSEFENVLAGSANDRIIGDANANFINAGAGNDTILSGGGNDTIWAGAGNDSVVVGTGVVSVDGGAGTDTLDLSLLGTVTLNQVGGVNYFTNGLGSTVMATNFEAFVGSSVAGSGNLNLVGPAAGEVIYGGNGNDTIDGGAGNDTIYGGAGDDSLFGGTGFDVLYGGAGNDTLYSTSMVNYDTYYGGDGIDWLNFNPSGAGTSVRVNIDMVNGTISMAGWTGVERFFEIENIQTGYNITADSIVGDSNANYIISGGGNDTINSGGGDDIVHVGHGADRANLGTGNDIFAIENWYLSDTVADTIDGGTGYDAIRLEGSNVNLNLTLARFGDANFENFERIDLNGSANKLTLGAVDVLDLTDLAPSLATLVINGDATNQVTGTGFGSVAGAGVVVRVDVNGDGSINGSEQFTTNASGQVTADLGKGMQTYFVYSNTVSYGTLLVDADIQRTIV